MEMEKFRTGLNDLVKTFVEKGTGFTIQPTNQAVISWFRFLPDTTSYWKQQAEDSLWPLWT